tara:strand:+ start:56 stop:226 length:171 start_codon:yes stop_codon:yes gene_type:complete
MNPTDILNQLNNLQEGGVAVKVDLAFSNKDYIKMGGAVFVGLFLALFLSSIVLKKI